MRDVLLAPERDDAARERANGHGPRAAHAVGAAERRRRAQRRPGGQRVARSRRNVGGRVEDGEGGAGVGGDRHRKRESRRVGKPGVGLQRPQPPHHDRGESQLPAGRDDDDGVVVHGAEIDRRGRAGVGRFQRHRPAGLDDDLHGPVGGVDEDEGARALRDGWRRAEAVGRARPAPARPLSSHHANSLTVESLETPRRMTPASGASMAARRPAAEVTRAGDALLLPPLGWAATNTIRASITGAASPHAARGAPRRAIGSRVGALAAGG